MVPRGGGDMTRRIPFVLTLLSGIAATASGQSPIDPLNVRGGNRFTMPNQVAPDLDRPIPGTLQHPHVYDITPESGAWAICVMSYAGPTAGSLAFDLVSELRKEYKLPGYLYNRSEELRKQEKERVEALRRQRQEFFQRQGIPMPERVYEKRMLHIEAQYAVLIADAKFKTIDDARHALNQIRKLKPPPERLRD